MIKRPSDSLRTCGRCHKQVADSYSKSLHYTTAGQRNGVIPRFSKAELKAFDAKVFEQSCRSCHASCGDCHVKVPAVGGISIGLIQKHKFVKKDEGKTCAFCHGDRVYPEYTGEYGGSPDVHYQKGMTCRECYKKAELHGDGTAYAAKQAVKDRPSCGHCHKLGQEAKLTAKISHQRHEGKVSCYGRHTATAYRQCQDCHLGKGAAAKPALDSIAGDVWKMALHGGGRSSRGENNTDFRQIDLTTYDRIGGGLRLVSSRRRSPGIRSGRPGASPGEAGCKEGSWNFFKRPVTAYDWSNRNLFASDGRMKGGLIKKAVLGFPKAVFVADRIYSVNKGVPAGEPFLGPPVVYGVEHGVTTLNKRQAYEVRGRPDGCRDCHSATSAFFNRMVIRNIRSFLRDDYPVLKEPNALPQYVDWGLKGCRPLSSWEITLVPS